MAQDVVTRFEWLTVGKMMDDLGLAETRRGAYFGHGIVGFLAAFQECSYYGLE